MRVINRIVDWISTPYTVYLIIRDPRIPRVIKIRAIIGLAMIFVYIISPIDVIPEFIPLAGWLDDLIIIPIGFALLRHFTPGMDVAEKQARAEKSIKRLIFRTILALAALVLFFLGLLALVIFLIVKLISG